MPFPLFRHACRCCGLNEVTFWFVGGTTAPVYVELHGPNPPHPKSPYGQAISHTLDRDAIAELHGVLTRWLDGHPDTIPRRAS